MVGENIELCDFSVMKYERLYHSFSERAPSEVCFQFVLCMPIYNRFALYFINLADRFDGSLGPCT